MGLTGVAGMAGGAIGLGAGMATMVLLDKASRATDHVSHDPVEADGLPGPLAEVRVVARHDDGSITVEPMAAWDGTGGRYGIEPSERERVRIENWTGPAEDDEFHLRTPRMGGPLSVSELERDVPLAERVQARNLGLAIGGGAALAGGAALGFGVLATGSSLAPAAKLFGTALFGVPAAIAGVTLGMWMFDNTASQARDLGDALNPMPRLD